MPDDGADDIDAFNAAMAANRPATAGAMPEVRVIAGGGITDRKGDVVVWSDAEDWTEATLAPRPWVVPGYAMRGAVTIVAGPGSAGKSTILVGWAVAAALGETLGAFVPPGPLKVLSYNVEDDADEQRRRTSAALRPHGRQPRDLRGKVIRCGPAAVGTLLERDAGTGEIRFTSAWAGLRALIAAHRPDLVLLDPLVELHTAEENDNTALRLVVAHLRALAQEFRCALVLVHHTRKGAVAGDVDAIRGAGSLVGAARQAFTVTPMSEAEAEELGITPILRTRFVRVDSVKRNYAPASEADWHELQEYELDNGETVAAAVPWKCPSAAKGPAPEALALLAGAIGRGTASGPYSPRLAVDQDRSVAPLLAQHGFTSLAAQKGALKALLREGFSVQRFRTSNGDERNGLRAPDGAPSAKWVEG